MKRMRFFVVLAGFLSVYSLLGFSLYRLQIREGAYYSARAESRYLASSAIRAKRGTIYATDKNENKIPLALNKDFPTIFAVPVEIDDPSERARQIVELLGGDVATIEKQFNKEKDLYELLVERATDVQVAVIKDAAIPGIYIDYEKDRFYPFGQLAAHVLGYVGFAEDDQQVGRYGLESRFEETLHGVAGSLEENTDPQDGDDIYTTIDRNIQAEAEKMLTGLAKKFDAVGGTVIVQEPSTGKILALANVPTFDPNMYFESSVSAFLNPAVQAVYEPGSIIKVMTMAAALDTGAIRPDTTYYDSGSLTLNGHTIKNWDLKAHGTLTMTGVIEGSINTGAVFAQQKTGGQKFYEYLKAFGLGEKTGIALPGEVVGSVYNLENSPKDINYATAAFGQGISLTPIRLMSAISAIANDGVLMRPYIIADSEPEVVRRVISKQSADETTGMMVSAVSKAVVAAIPHYTVAGKTGTAQIPDLKNGGYLEAYVHTYVGFAPASNPRFTILIKLDKPNVVLAGATVVPAFHDLAQYIINYLGIAPDNL